jgi:hypothetical protein
MVLIVWLEKDGRMVTLNAGVSNNTCSVSLYIGTSAATAPGAFSRSGSYYWTATWSPTADEKKSTIRGEVVVKHEGVIYYGQKNYKAIEDTIANVSTGSGGWNQDDIDAIKTAVGVGEAQTVWEKANDILTAIGTVPTGSSIWTTLSGINQMWTDNLIAVNWTDIKVMSSVGVNWRI